MRSARGSAQAKDPAFDDSGKYEMLDGSFKLPTGRKVRSTAGFAVDRDGGSIWVFERCGGNACPGFDVAPILKFDAARQRFRRAA